PIARLGMDLAKRRNHPALARSREQVRAIDEIRLGRVADRATTVRQALPAERPGLVGLGVGDVGEPAFGRVDPKVERRPVGPSERDDDGELAGALAEPVDGDDHARSPSGLLMAFDGTELAVPDLALAGVGDAQASAPTSA